MRTPKRPPNYTQLFQDATKDPERLVKIVTLLATLRDKYYHWDELIHRDPPESLSHEEWWLLLKMQRGRSPNLTPLKDKNGRLFHYNLETEQILKGLHHIDRGSGGSFLAPDEIINPETRNRYLERSLVEEAITSSQLEGAVTTRKVAREMIRSGRKPSDISERMIINNYLTMERIRELRSEPLNRALILEIHRIIAQGTLENPDEEGRFRKQGEHVRVYWNATGEVLHDPPQSEELEERIKAMCDFANGKTPSGFIHPVIRSIVLHFWLAYDHPFIDGNGRVARALFYWSMLKNGFWLFAFVSISEIIRKSPGQYRRAFLYTETDENDLTYFIIYHLKVMQRSIEALHEYIKRKKKQLRILEGRIRITTFNHRQRALLSHALRNPYYEYTIWSHMRSHRVAYATARTDLLDLRDKGLFTSKKIGKTYYFTPVEGLEEKLGTLAP